MAEETDVMIRFGAAIGEFLAGANEVKEKIEGIGETAHGLVSAFSGIAEALAAAFAVEKIAEFAEHFTKLGATVEHFHQQLGISSSDVSAFAFAAGAMGVGLEGAAMSMERMQRNMAMAAHETGPAATAFEALGISVKNGSGGLKTLDEILPEIANKFAASANGPEKTAIAMALLGRAGAQMIPFLNEGAAGLAHFKQIAQDAGTVITDSMAHGMEQTEIAMYTLGQSVQGVGLTIYQQFKPALDVSLDVMIRLVQQFNNAIKEGGAFGDVMSGIATSIRVVVAAFIELIAGVQQTYHVLAAFFGAFAAALDGVGFAIARLMVGNLKGAQAALKQGGEDMVKTFAEHMAAVGKIGADAAADIKKLFAAMHDTHEADKPNLKAPDFGKDASEQMKLWKDALQKMLLDNGVFLADSKRQELAYWTDRLSTVQGSTIREKAIRLSIESEIYQLKKGIAKQDADDYVAGLNAKMEAVKYDFLQVMAIEDQKMAFLKANYHEDSRQFQDALREKERLQTAHQDMMNRIVLASDNTQRDISKMSIDIERNRLDTLVTMNQISETERLNAESNFLEREYQLKMAALQQELKLPRQNEQQIADINNRILVLQKQHSVEMNKIVQDQNLAAFHQWKSLFDSIGSGFDTMIKGILMGTQTLRQAWRNILQNMVLSFIGARIQIELTWLAGQAAMALGAQEWATKSLFAWVASLLGIQTADTAAQAKGVAAAGARGSAEISAAGTAAGAWTIAAGIIATTAAAAALSAAFDFALEGAVAAMASVAAIPVWGWAAAPEVGAAFLENAMMYTAGIGMSVPGLATGTMDVPQDMLAQLHAGEAVVPKPFAESMRDGMMGGGGGLTVSVTMTGISSARDIPGLKSAIIDASREAHRNFVAGSRR